MNEVFYLTRGWRNATYILHSALICISIGLLIYFKTYTISLLIITYAIYNILQADEKIYWDTHSVRKVSRLVNRQIPLDDIKGFKFAWNYLHIIPHKGKGKRILVSTYINGMRLLHAELISRYPDLNQSKPQ